MTKQKQNHTVVVLFFIDIAFFRGFRFANVVAVLQQKRQITNGKPIAHRRSQHLSL